MKIRDVDHDLTPCHDPAVDVDFANYLKGKSVAIVGRAEYLRETEQGDEIDSYDVVVRLHNPAPYCSNRLQGNAEWNLDDGYFVPPELHDKLGTRVNVFYQNIYWVTEGEFEWFVEWFDAFRKDEGKFIGTEMPSAAGKGFVYQPVREKVLGMLHSVTYQDEIWRKLLTFCHRLNAKVYSGVMAILDIARYEVGDVYITGFPQMLDMPIRPINIDFKSACLNLIYLHALVEKRGFKVDGTMRAIFDKYVGFGKYLGWSDDETY